MQRAKQKQAGFTIVELLIVIVVIAILAAITIVAYNGIQDRAKNAAAQSAASQAAKKLQAYAVLNSDQYPTTLADADIQNTDGTLQYTGGGTTFCVTATTQNVSYFQRNTTQAAKGACEGHGKDGVAAVTNLATNPSLELNATNWTTPFGSGAISGARDTLRAYAGSTSLKVTRNSVNADSRMVRYNVANHPLGTYSFGAWVYVADSVIGNVNISFEFCGSTGSAVGSTTTSGGAIGQWRRVSGSYTVTVVGNLCINIIAGQNQVGTLFIDAAMQQEGATLANYADGATAGWAWTGTAHASTSRGVPE